MTVLGLLLLIPGFFGCRWWWNVSTTKASAGARVADDAFEPLVAAGFVLLGLVGLVLLAS